MKLEKKLRSNFSDNCLKINATPDFSILTELCLCPCYVTIYSLSSKAFMTFIFEEIFSLFSLSNNSKGHPWPPEFQHTVPEDDYKD